MIQDVVNRVILEGDEQAAQSLDAAALLEDPSAAVSVVAVGKHKKVKEMAGKFGAAGTQAASVESADTAAEK